MILHEHNVKNVDRLRAEGGFCYRVSVGSSVSWWVSSEISDAE